MRLTARRGSRNLCDPFGRRTRSQSGQEIAEFGAVLFVILLVIFFPFVDMLLYFASYGVIYITCNLAVRAAAPTFTYADSSSGGKVAYTNMINTPFLKAIGAAAHASQTGAQAYTLSLLQGNSAGTLSSATPGSVTLPVPSGTFYLYQVSTVQGLTLSPLFPLPFVGMGGGQPVSFHATCFVEHPEGLNN